MADSKRTLPRDRRGTASAAARGGGAQAGRWETAASWMPEPVAEAWTESVAEMSKGQWPAPSGMKEAWDYWVDAWSGSFSSSMSCAGVATSTTSAWRKRRRMS